jgi:ribonuclease Y
LLLGTRVLLTRRARAAEEERRRLSDVATRAADAIRREAEVEAREHALKARAEIDQELGDKRAEVIKIEERIAAKEAEIDRKLTEFERREQGFADRETHLKQLQEELKAARDNEIRELERISGLTSEDAKRQLLEHSEELVRHDLARMVRQLEEEARSDAKRRARNLVADALQRVAASHAAETTVSLVELPSDDMKGRIIGREGRNIRAFESLTGVNLIVDDTPEAVTISAFDPVRREVARRALNKLLQDGRIHPTRIEEIVAKTRTELEQVMREEGEKIAYEANVPGLHPDLIKLLGRLKFRTSYGQNVLGHSLETSMIAAALAAELGADVNVAKTAGLLHDIGKAVDHEVEGPHALIGADIAKRLGRSSKIVHAIAAHHGEEEPQTIEAFIVATADAISGARPGARREMVETYIKRLEALEGVANSFDGVEKSFAIQAGREVRILVAPDSIDDLAAARLARDVSKKIEESLEYPGQIKVTVIRETRAVDYAR